MNARRMTGRHMAAILCGFFGVVIAVNLLMATLATRTFGGVVVQNSYVASQKFNGWLAEARRQDALGWSATAGLAADRTVTLDVAGPQATATGVASHPLGREADVPLRFRVENGRLVSDRPLPAGRWHVRLTIRRGSEEIRLLETLA